MSASLETTKDTKNIKKQEETDGEVGF